MLSCHLCQKSDDCRFMGLFLDCPVPLICLPNFIPAPHWINYYTYMGGPEIWWVSSPTFSSSPSGRPSRSLALCISVKILDSACPFPHKNSAIDWNHMAFMIHLGRILLSCTLMYYLNAFSSMCYTSKYLMSLRNLLPMGLVC